MTRWTVRLFLIFLPFVFLGGCVYDAVNLRAFMAPGVDRFPTKIAFFPFLSAPGQAGTWSPYRYYRMESAGTPALKKRKATLDIIPPTDSNFGISQESQILTDLVTTDLAAKGFTLQQLPVETQEAKDSAGKPVAPRGFYISLDLLKELEQKYGLEAVVLGDSYFTYDAYSRQTKVILAHLKVVDIKTLRVLAEVGTAYNPDGFDLNQIADQITDNMAGLAGKTPTARE